MTKPQQLGTTNPGLPFNYIRLPNGTVVNPYGIEGLRIVRVSPADSTDSVPDEIEGGSGSFYVSIISSARSVQVSPNFDTSDECANWIDKFLYLANVPVVNIV